MIVTRYDIGTLAQVDIAQTIIASNITQWYMSMQLCWRDQRCQQWGKMHGHPIIIFDINIFVLAYFLTKAGKGIQICSLIFIILEELKNTRFPDYGRMV